MKTELGLLWRLIREYNVLLGSGDATPAKTEILAVSAVLHSFYSGVENAFKRIALEIDRDMPSGARSHRELLMQMAEPRSQRPAVISSELRRRLVEYLDFRHVFRHAYSFHLDWDKMSGLAGGAEETLRLLESELTEFFGPEGED